MEFIMLCLSKTALTQPFQWFLGFGGFLLEGELSYSSAVVPPAHAHAGKVVLQLVLLV